MDANSHAPKLTVRFVILKIYVQFLVLNHMHLKALLTLLYYIKTIQFIMYTLFDAKSPAPNTNVRFIILKYMHIFMLNHMHLKQLFNLL